MRQNRAVTAKSERLFRVVSIDYVFREVARALPVRRAILSRRQGVLRWVKMVKKEKVPGRVLEAGGTSRNGVVALWK